MLTELGIELLATSKNNKFVHPILMVTFTEYFLDKFTAQRGV